MFHEIKSHFKNNKRIYIFAGIAGITCIIMKGRYATLLQGVDGPLRVTMRPFSFSFYDKSSNVVTTIHSGGRGHPGFRVKNLEYDLEFDTQGAAARAFKIPENVISGHLNNKFDDAYGLHFEHIKP